MEKSEQEQEKIVHVTCLTVYTYDNKVRKSLNIEEAEKFGLGLKRAGNINELVIFTDIKDIHSIISTLSEEEQNAFRDMILAPIEFQKRAGVKVEFASVDLTDFEDTYSFATKKLGHYANSSATVKIYANLSGGHKIGALAVYVALLNIVINEKKKVCKSLFLYPYHAEREIADLPVINIKTTVQELEFEKYLGVFANPITYDEAKKIIMKDGNSSVDVAKITQKMKKRKLIEQVDNRVVLTTRGKTLLAMLNAIHGQ